MSEKLREALAHCCNVLERVPNASNSPVITIAVINGRKALAEPAPAPSDFERVFTDACDEIGCAHDNEALLEAIASLKKSAVTPHERWQPIETAPRDGSHILGYRLPIGIRVTNLTNPPAVVHWFDDPQEPGFYTSVNERAPEYPFNPTHWQPLPAPPAITRADCGGGK